MASQITHAALTKLVWPKLQALFKEAPFLIGTIFPDIRYLKVISRERTHISNLKFSDVLTEPNAFAAGLKFHSFVDETRERFMVGRGVYGLLPESRYITQAMKLYEDEIYYPLVGEWARSADALDRVLLEQTALGVAESDVRRWHDLVRTYFVAGPSAASRAAFIRGLGFPTEVVEEVEGLVQTMSGNTEFTAAVRDFWNAFDAFCV